MASDTDSGADAGTSSGAGRSRDMAAIYFGGGPEVLSELRERLPDRAGTDGSRGPDSTFYGERVPQSLEELIYKYREHPDRYIHFGNDVLGIRFSREQRRLLRAIATHEKVIVVSGNGVGKSFGVGAAILGYLYTHDAAFVLGTSGSYSQFVDGMWRSMIVEMFEPARARMGLPGHATWGNQPQLEVTKNWYAKIVSPKKPKGLEGRHAEHGMVVIEEADDPDITHEHLSAARSSTTSKHDRLVVVANPPVDETDIVASLLNDDKYHTIQYSSFESHNARIDAGELAADRIPGLVDLHTIREDWEDYNKEQWPGWEVAKHAHEERDDLSVNWYRRRAGVIPKDDSTYHRPYRVSDVSQAVGRRQPPRTEFGAARAVAVDVARKGGDLTVICVLYPHTLEFTAWSHTDHRENRQRIRDFMSGLQRVPYMAVDAIGEGSGIADDMKHEYGAERFKSGTRARDATEFANMWTEAVYHFGNTLESLCLSHLEQDPRDELYAGARVLKFEEVAQKSGDVLRATPKSAVKQRVGNSPDYLDAAVMSAWVVNAGGRRLPLTW